MDATKPLLSRLEAIKSESSELDLRLSSLRNEAKEIESALRTLNRYIVADDSAEGVNVEPIAEKNTPNITDAILEAITACGDKGATSSEIKDYMQIMYGLEPKPETLSVTIQRHKQKDRIVNRSNRWFLTSLAPEMDAKTEETPVLEAQGHINSVLN
jgi:hypothetical protein